MKYIESGLGETKEVITEDKNAMEIYCIRKMLETLERDCGSDMQRGHNGHMNKTNDEIIWDIFKYIITLPEDDFIKACDYMRSDKSKLAENVIHIAKKKRRKIAQYL